MSGKRLRDASHLSRFVLQGEMFLCIVALAVLALGAWVYVVERPAAATPFFSSINLSHRLPALLGVVGNCLPTFAHTFSFSIFTALIMGATGRAVFWGCLTWLLVGVAFEVGQHPNISSILSEGLALPVSLKAYFVSGTFDVFDLLSIFGGAIFAYLILINISVPHKPMRRM